MALWQKVPTNTPTKKKVTPTTSTSASTVRLLLALVWAMHCCTTLLTWCHCLANTTTSTSKVQAAQTVKSAETLYRWLHSGYTDAKSKNPATKKIAGFPLLYWCRRDESNTRPSHYE